MTQGPRGSRRRTSRPSDAACQPHPRDAKRPQARIRRAFSSARSGTAGNSRAVGGLRATRCYIRSIIAWPKPEHDTCVAPSIRRAKS